MEVELGGAVVEDLRAVPAVVAGGLDRIDPLLQGDGAAAGPHVARDALVGDLPGGDRHAVADVDGADEVLVEPSDLLRRGAGDPEVPEVHDDPRVGAVDHVEDPERLVHVVDGRPAQRLEEEVEPVVRGDVRGQGDVLGGALHDLLVAAAEQAAEAGVVVGQAPGPEVLDDGDVDGAGAHLHAGRSDDLADAGQPLGLGAEGLRLILLQGADARDLDALQVREQGGWGVAGV